MSRAGVTPPPVDDGEPREPSARERYALRIQLDGFEGPLDLLLHLIQKHELDILDIPIAFITEEYLSYLDAMADLDLGVAGEYLVMAATLLQLKSAMLLPREPSAADEDSAEEGDPRADLIRRLLEYQKYKEAAATLAARPRLDRQTFARATEAIEAERVDGPAELLPLELFTLLDVYRRLVDREQRPRVHEVSREELSLKESIGSIATVLDDTPRVTLTELIGRLDATPSTYRVVITFMSLLEMAKLRLVRLFQARLSIDDLVVERAVLNVRDLTLSLGLDDNAAVTRS